MGVQQMFPLESSSRKLFYLFHVFACFFWAGLSVVMWNSIMFDPLSSTMSSKIINTVVRTPLRHLYLNGPEFEFPWIGRVGFWRGRPFSIICSFLMNSVPVDWSLHQNQIVCQAQIEQQINSWVCCLLFILYCACLWFSCLHIKVLFAFSLFQWMTPTLQISMHAAA